MSLARGVNREGARSKINRKALLLPIAIADRLQPLAPPAQLLGQCLRLGFGLLPPLLGLGQGPLGHIWKVLLLVRHGFFLCICPPDIRRATPMSKENPCRSPRQTPAKARFTFSIR